MIQEQFLNKLLQTKDASLITLNNLTADFFSDHKSEFNYIKNHLSQYSVIPDIETFLNMFPDFELITVNEPNNYLLEELMRDKNKRFAAENYSKARQLLMDNKVEEAMRVLKEAAETSSTFVSVQAVDLITDHSRYDTYQEMIDNHDKYFITTGFKELDRIIGGWNAKEDVATIVARNGLGKSWILFKCAAAAARAGRTVGIYSGEMSEDSVGYRIDTLLGHISNGSLVHGSASVRNQYKNFLSKLQNEVPGKLWVTTPKLLGGTPTVSALRAFIEKYNIDILFVDQRSLLEDERGAKNPVDIASNISKDLKLLQSLKQIPVITVNQQNRDKVEGENGNKTFDTTQVAQSDRIAQDSSIIIFIERKDDLMKLHLVKSRQSNAGDVLTYRIGLNEGEFEYVPDEKSNSDEDVESNYSTEEVEF